VTKDFQMTVLGLNDGRVVNGIVTSETDAALTVQTAQGKVVVPKSDVEERKRSNQSLMPDGLLQTLTPGEVRDLIAYLMSDSQVALPAGTETAGPTK
jgi:putative heme-binding domain-containing protein